jgi:4-hydroxy-3-methylbut-2-en-1-yl diphosphate reductase
VEIILAQSAGFCFGVKRATNIAFQAAERYHPICSLGPIIHSPQVVKQLEEKGVAVARKIEDISEGAVIIRSHGITANELNSILSRNLKIIDATCPFVKKAQEYAALLSRNGYVVGLVGEEEHPEVQGIISYARKGQVFVVADRRQAEILPYSHKIGVVAQTTQSLDNLRQVVEVCLEKSKELKVFNTICDATSVRQKEAQTIARKVDLMLVIGGYKSANTTRLARICREIQPLTYHVEMTEQIDSDWFYNVKTIGVTAGASTPRWVIDSVMEKVRAIGK